MLTGRSSSIPSNIVCPLLVGRDQQLEELNTLLKLAAQGAGQIALISSEAGVGKTRLFRALSVIARKAGFSTWIGECFEQQQNLPYGVLLDLLRWYRDQHPGSVESVGFSFWSPDFAGLLPGYRSALEISQAWSDADSSQEKQRFFYALERLLSSQVASQPLLFIIEDIHWSDAVSLEFLLYWTWRVRNLPVLFCCLIATRNTANLSSSSSMKSTGSKVLILPISIRSPALRLSSCCELSSPSKSLSVKNSWG